MGRYVFLCNEYEEDMKRVEGNIIDVVRHSEEYIVYVLYTLNGKKYIGEASNRLTSCDYSFGQSVLLEVYKDGKIIIKGD